VTNVIQEETFLRTLDQGLQLLDNVIATNHGKEQKHLNCNDTFVSIDLTALILREGFSLDEAGFDKAMLEQNTFTRSLKFQRMIGRF
jgi:alanyl-tRNA synthetase